MDYSIESCINKKLHIKLKKRITLIIDSNEEIKNILNKENYDVKHINFQNNSINGLINRGCEKYFFKILNNQEFIHEVTGYIQIKDTLPVNKVKEIFEFQNYYLIIYEYENTIGKNEGLLNDFFVKNDLKIEADWQEVTDSIISLYRKIFKKTIIKEKYPMQLFFENRIISRLKKWYDNEKLLNYNVVINGLESKRTREIMDECITFFNSNHELECSLSQGDPNTLNIGTKPIFFDFETSGYNPIICEFSAIFWSVLIADPYFCTKYHPKSYYNHQNAFKNIDKFSPDLKYEINNIDKKINIQSNIKTSKIRIQFIKEYIKNIEDLDIKIGKEIIYFLTMRILCIFDIRTMEMKDYFYSIFILHYLYENISKDVYTNLKNIIDSFDLIK